MEVGIKPHHRCLGKHTERRERGTVGHCTDQNKVCHWFMCMLYSIVQCDRFISLLHRNGFAVRLGSSLQGILWGQRSMTLLPVSFLLFFSLRKVVLFHLFLFFILYLLRTIHFLYVQKNSIRQTSAPLNLMKRRVCIGWVCIYMQLFFFFLFKKNITYPSYTFDMTRFVSFFFFFFFWRNRLGLSLAQFFTCKF